jgi:hypothetical protein
MPILYIPNDPEARRAPKAARIRPSRARPAGRADFALGTLPRAQAWPLDSDEFLRWQCREALLRATAMWEKIAGPLKRWQHGAKLRVDADIGEELNAYYDRESVGYARQASSRNGRLRRFAASVDVVAHEAGHAFLDAIRPELWDSNLPEPNAFHEAFGDCVAILTALADRDLRRALLSGDPTLAKANFAETLMESLANGIRDEQPGHNAAKPRRGRNRLKWTFFTTLPPDGGPGELIADAHSFGQVFVGCFYDTLRNVYLLQKRRDEAALWKAAHVAGKLLVRGARKAPHGARFFQAVGRAMTLEDDALHRGRHHDCIRLAFEAHGILLGSVAALAPRAILHGPAPKSAVGTGQAAMAKATLDDLRTRLQLPATAALRLRSYDLGGRAVTEACHERRVPLAGLSERLADVVAIGVEPTLVGAENRRAAVLGALPDPQATEDEVRAFVRGLVARNQIAYDEQARHAAAKRATRRGRGAVVGTGGAPTHSVVVEAGQPVLKRVRYACGCGTRTRD